jgi:acyl-coenzyme A thioesterase PaaI-like protein
MTNNMTIGGFTDAYAGLDGAAPDYEKIREISASLVPFGNHAGIEITEVGPEHAVAEIPDLPQLTNHLGTVHAGAQFLAADIAGAAAFVGAAATRLSSVDLLVLRNGTASFRKPATGRIRATATVDEREMRRIRAAEGKQRFDLDGRALLHDEAGVLVAKFTFEYVCTLG